MAKVNNKENKDKEPKSTSLFIIILVLVLGLIGGFLIWKFLLKNNSGDSGNSNILLLENLP